MPEATLMAPVVLDVVRRDTRPIVRPRTWPLAGSLAVLLVVLFGAWSARFIWGSSFIAIDRQRHFSLFDDAMVSLRYAWNLAHGAGLVWNPGEYVEGYTNLLMTLLMTLAVRIFGRDFSPLAVQVFGLFTVLGCAALAVKVSDQLADRESPAIANVRRFVVGASVLMLYPLVYWSEMGMETGLLTLLLLASFATAFSASKPQRLIVLAGLLGLAYLTRPDSAIFAALILGYASFEQLRVDWRSRQSLWLIGAAGLVLLAFPVTETVFRWFYYGELVPNTYTLKVAGIPLLVRVSNGWIYVRNFLPSVAPMLLLGGIGSVAGLRLRRLLIGAVVLAAGAYQVYVGGDVWPYWRMLTPVLPLLSILTVFTALEVARFCAARTSLQFTWVSLGVASLITMIGVGALDYPFRREIVLLDRPYHAEENATNTNIGLAINAVTTPEASAGVFWAGAIPYYADRRGVDFLGKADPTIARLQPDLSGVLGGYGMSTLPGHNKYDLDYSIKTLQPTYIQWFLWGRQNVGAWAEQHYELAEYRNVFVIVRKDSPDVLWDRVDARQALVLAQ